MLRKLIDQISPSRSSRTLVNVLRIIWILILIHGEYLIFWKAARHCAPWPNTAAAQRHKNLDRLLLVGDPQLTDSYSYDRPGFLLRIAEFYSDVYLGRNYRHLQKRLTPKGTIFMGDLMDGGREWNDLGFKQETIRFRRLLQSERPQFFMAGNHDLGFGDGIQPHVAQRFQSEFGPTSYTFRAANYSIVVIDTVSLSAHTDLQTKQQAWDVIERQLPPHPRILFTHVPLHRPPGTDCGPNRQGRSREIRQGHGYQYQNLVDETLSQQLLDRISPIAVFSGDDHDYCYVEHGPGKIPEISVPTTSMAQGVQYPGVVLLDLSPDTEYFATKLCWLPGQIPVFIGYGCMAALSIVILAVWHVYRWARRSQRWSFGKDDDILPAPLTLNTRNKHKSTRKRLDMFSRDVLDVASVGVAVYLLFLVLL